MSRRAPRSGRRIAPTDTLPPIWLIQELDGRAHPTILFGLGTHDISAEEAFSARVKAAANRLPNTVVLTGSGRFRLTAKSKKMTQAELRAELRTFCNTHLPGYPRKAGE